MLAFPILGNYIFGVQLSYICNNISWNSMHAPVATHS